MNIARCIIFVGALAVSLGQGAMRGELGTASFHIGAMSCVSCEKAIRSNLSKMTSVQVVLASYEAKRMQLRFDLSKVSMQQVLATVRGKEGNYEARLALRYQVKNVAPALAEHEQLALSKVPGVRAASLPDDKGIILITFRSQPPTYLPEILKAASDAGAPLEDPEQAVPK